MKTGYLPEQLDFILNLLNEEVLIKEIDQPLELAINSFVFKLMEKITYKEFNAIMASFYQHLNQHGLRITRKLSNSEALNEVIWLIENHYRGYETSGYDGAVFDALSQGEGGILLILGMTYSNYKINRTHKIHQLYYLVQLLTRRIGRLERSWLKPYWNDLVICSLR